MITGLTSLYSIDTFILNVNESDLIVSLFIIVIMFVSLLIKITNGSNVCCMISFRPGVCVIGTLFCIRPTALLDMFREMRGRVGCGHYGHKMKERKGDSQYPVWGGREGGREGGVFTAYLRRRYAIRPPSGRAMGSVLR